MGDVLGVNGLFRALPAGYVLPRERDRQGGDGTTVPDSRSAGLERGDGLELSELGKLLSEMVDTPGIHLARIARIRTAIDTGTYETPAKIAAVVDGLVEELKK